MNLQFLSHFIKNCPLNDFTEDSNSEKKHEILDSYLEEFTNFLYTNEPQITEQFWSEYFGSSEVTSLISSEMLRRCLIFLDTTVSIYNYTARKTRTKKSTDLKDQISIQLQNDFNQFKSILLLAMNGCFNSVIAEYRIFYESFVIGQYLFQNPDLIPMYKEHSQFLKYHLTRVVGNSKPEWDAKYDSYIQKYGKEFTENYGWTMTKIPKKNERTIGSLAKACNLEDCFTSLYKFSCSYIHSSAFSVSTKSDLQYIKIFLQASMHFLDTEIANYLGVSGITTKDGIILRNILLFLYEDFEKEFCKK